MDGKRYIGWHRVDLYVEGVKVASEQFELYDATCRGQVTFAEANKVQEYERLADHYRRQGDEANHQETRKKLIVAHHNRAGTCYINGNLEAAIEHFSKALNLFPDYDLAYRNRGGVRAEMGDLSGALADYDRAIRLDPQDAEYYDSRAMARFWLGDHAGALRDMDEAVRLNPKRVEFYEHRGVIRAHLRDRARAIQDFQQAASRYEKSKRDYDRVQEYIAAVHRHDDSALTLPKHIRSFRH